jgi:hypothetical protein
VAAGLGRAREKNKSGAQSGKTKPASFTRTASTEPLPEARFAHSLCRFVTPTAARKLRPPAPATKPAQDFGIPNSGKPRLPSLAQEGSAQGLRWAHPIRLPPAMAQGTGPGRSCSPSTRQKAPSKSASRILCCLAGAVRSAAGSQNPRQGKGSASERRSSQLHTSSELQGSRKHR